MADKNEPKRPLKDGYVPLKKGWEPKVTGGFKPTSSSQTATPPKGGSGVKPPPPPVKK
jgi:hypothetical protein